MLQLPPIPSWDALHPLIIHFPIVLLMVAPLLIVVGAVLQPEKGRPYQLMGLTLMLLGTLAVYVAVGTGEAAGELAERTQGVSQVLENHETLAERTRIVFTVLTVIFAAMLFVPKLMKHSATRLTSTTLPIAFLVFYCVGVVLLVNTAHNGGRLVHEFGVRAMVASSPLPDGSQPVLNEQRSGEAGEGEKE